jgi:uncharacterized protein (TIGR04255 family)
MAENGELLPSFHDPPLHQVAMVLQFDRLADMRNKHMFELWTLYRDRYPNVDEHQPLPPFREIFGVRRKPERVQRVRINPGPEVLRYAFTEHGGGAEHIQVQSDRFSFFWQRHRANQEYPRFAALLEAFRRDFAIFRQFVRDAALGDIVPNQCALSYTNRIPKGRGWDVAADLAHVFPFWGNQYSESVPLDLEDFGFGRIYTVRSAEGAQVARLYVVAHKDVFPPEAEESVELDLTVRGPPELPTEDKVIEFFEMARRKIVTTFPAVTSKQMHELWGRIQ